MTAAPRDPRSTALLAPDPAPTRSPADRAGQPRRGWLITLAILLLAALSLIAWNAWQLGAATLATLAGRAWFALARALLHIPGLDTLVPSAAPWLDALPWLAWLALGITCALMLARPSHPALPSLRAPVSDPPPPLALPILSDASPPTPTTASPPAPAAAQPPAPSTSSPASSVGAFGERPPPDTASTTALRVFISHSSGDNAFGTGLVDRLRAEGIDAWYDSHGGPNAAGQWQDSIPPATYWQDEIVRELTARPIFLVILSPLAVTSRWVHDEIGLAWSEKNSADITRGKIVVPVLREMCPVPPLVSLVQYVDYRPAADQEKAWRDLLYALRAGRTIPAPPVELGPPFDLGLLPPLERFVGREDAVRRVMALLTGEPLDGVALPGGVASVAAANGMAGIGKTALATEVVRRLMARNAFPDGAAVVICKDQRDPVALLRRIIARFTTGRREPDEDDLPALADRARQILGGKRALIALDNIEPALPLRDVLSPLRAAGAAVLLTSRAELPAVPPEARLKLEVLPVEEALDVFAEYYGRGAALDLTRPELDATRRIVTALGRHTLAIKLAAANAMTLNRPLATLADEYERDPRRALWLEDGEEAVRAVLDSSFAALSAAGQTFFTMLAAFATADAGRQAALAVATATAPEGTADEERLERGLRAMVALRMGDAALNESMPEGSDRERLRLHPLLQTYARDLLAQRPPAEREAAARAVAAWYAGYANETKDEALGPDEENIAGALEWAHQHEEYPLTARLCGGMQYFWRTRGRVPLSLIYLPWGVAAAEHELGEEPDTDHASDAWQTWQSRANRLFWLRLNLGFAYQMAGRLRMAEEQYGQCLDLARRAEIRRDEGAAISVIGQIALKRGRLDEAADYFAQSLVVLREVQDRRGEGVVLSSLGQIALKRGRLDEAADYFAQSLVIDREVQDRQGEGVDLSSLGQIALKRGRLDEAADYFAQSLVIDREVQDRQGEGVDLSSLGQIALARGRLDEAADYFAQSLVIRREVQDRQGEGVDLYELALIAEAQGDFDRAEMLHRESLGIGIEVQSGPDVADSLLTLGTFLIKHGRGQPNEGCGMLGEAVRLYHEMRLPAEEQARKTARALGCAVD